VPTNPAIDLTIDIIGWIGVAALLLAFFLVSTSRLTGDSPTYQLLNILGGAMLIVNSAYNGAFPSVGVNIAWIIIALYSLGRRIPASMDGRARKNRKPGTMHEQ
jgi:hypothetical protein